MAERPGTPRIVARRGGACSPRQAAAAIAAVERFLGDRAPVAEPAPGRSGSGWILAARDEAVDRL